MKKFVVGLLTGGLMEDPDIDLGNIQIIKADNEDLAVEKYNRVNKCSFFYGHCLGEVVDDKVTISMENIKYIFNMR